MAICSGGQTYRTTECPKKSVSGQDHTQCFHAAPDFMSERPPSDLDKRETEASRQGQYYIDGAIHL